MIDFSDEAGVTGGHRTSIAAAPALDAFPDALSPATIHSRFLPRQQIADTPLPELAQTDKRSSAALPLPLQPLHHSLHYRTHKSNTLTSPAMPVAEELAAKDALIKKQRDVIAKYLILDIEDFLAEAREKAEAETAEAYERALAEEKARGRVCRAHRGSSPNRRRSLCIAQDIASFICCRQGG